MKKRRTLVIVPTSGNIRGEDGRPLPGRAAQKRLLVASGFVAYRDEARLAICGGHRLNDDHNEARVAHRWLKDQGLIAARLVVICEGNEVFTAGDMTNLALSICKNEMDSGVLYETIYLVSHPWHARLAKITLAECLEKSRWIGIIDSGEPAPFSRMEYLIRLIVTRYDPHWEKIITLPLRFLSRNRRLAF